MERALFDTNIVIDVLTGREAGIEEFRRYATVPISVVTWIEVMAGVAPDDEAAPRRTLAGYERHELDTEIAERAAAIRRERRIKLPDAIIQASAETNGLTRVTRNERDFPEGTPGLRIPYRL